MKKLAIRIAVENDSAEALAIYREATGKNPPKLEPPDNTHILSFATKDGRAAVLVHQRGFEQEPGETWDDANGLSVAIALDCDAATGRAALDAWIEAEIPARPGTAHPL